MFIKRHGSVSAKCKISTEVFHMAKNHHLMQYLLLRNIAKSPSVPEALYMTYIGLSKLTNDCDLKEFEKKIMEPFFQNTVLTNPMNSMPKGTFCDTCMNSHCPEGTVEQDIMPYAIGNLDLNLTSANSLEDKYIKDKQNYRRMRRWQNIKGRRMLESSKTFKLRLLSFNILAQTLLESYPYLYKNHDKQALLWHIRKPLLWDEILSSEANIICLQEMEEKHLADFVEPFVKNGFAYLYKKRTNDKFDGLLLLYHADLFELVEHVKVEYYKPNIELLSRDNVGLVAKFQLKESPETRFIVATTHLLYNPRRNDVRLGQIQLLFSELEKMAFIKDSSSGPKYLPIILSGDFNLEPYTGVYKFITNGYFQFMGKGRQLNPTQNEQLPLQNSLIPTYLNVTDDCQRLDILFARLGLSDDTSETEKKSLKAKDKNRLNSVEPQEIKLAEGRYARFSSGSLSHPFKLRSVYSHSTADDQPEATTNQGAWITVDYIFYSGVEPLEEYALPSIKQCYKLPTIPNFAVGSDHLCLGATFAIKKKKSNKK